MTNARSRRTRVALLDAARALVEEHGIEAVTMAAVADRAQVTRRSVYLHFTSRTELVAALFDHVAETAGLDDSLARVFAADDPEAVLAEWARHLATYARPLVPFDRALRAGAVADAAARAHRDHAEAARLASCRRVIDVLRDAGALAPPWTRASATDALAALSTSDVVDTLLEQRGWSARAFRERMTVLLRRTFVA